MPRDAHLYIDDILEAIANIKEYTESMDYPTFLEDKKTRDATVLNGGK